MVKQIFCPQPPSPPPPATLGVKGQNSTFSDYGHVAYQTNRNHDMQQHGSKLFALKPSPLPYYPSGWGHLVKNQLFIAYQIKENHECSNKVAKIVPAESPLDPGDGVNMSKFIFLEHGYVAYQINGFMRCSNIVANVLPTDPPPPSLTTLGDGVKSSNPTFSENGHVAYQMHWNHECSNMGANI